MLPQRQVKVSLYTLDYGIDLTQGYFIPIVKLIW
jgi:hypothetical protein